MHANLAIMRLNWYQCECMLEQLLQRSCHNIGRQLTPVGSFVMIVYACCCHDLFLSSCSAFNAGVQLSLVQDANSHGRLIHHAYMQDLFHKQCPVAALPFPWLPGHSWALMLASAFSLLEHQDSEILLDLMAVNTLPTSIQLKGHGHYLKNDDLLVIGRLNPVYQH